MSDLRDVVERLDGVAAVTAPVLLITIADEAVEIVLGDAADPATVRSRWVLPVGIRVLQRQLGSDPPLPEELTNAIGAVVDHLDDAVRAEPSILDAGVAIATGAMAVAIAAVEVGHLDPVQLHGFSLERDAAEDVFRTLATEASPDRAHNPGLPAHAVASSVAACCALVGVMRRLHLDRVVVAVGRDEIRAEGSAR